MAGAPVLPVAAAPSIGYCSVRPLPGAHGTQDEVRLVEYVPHIALLLDALRVNRERLDSRSKIAIDARLLRTLLQALGETLPFSSEFYLQTYPDIAEAMPPASSPICCGISSRSVISRVA
jgi:hypothetical protein